jgi:sugar phosphate isomerase/epimerase
MNLIGIIQGRLSKAPTNKLQHFPKNYKNEFVLAKKAGFDYIEFFAERKFNKTNPIWSLKGIFEYKTLAKKNKLVINTFCDDFIISNSIKKKNTLKYITKLTNRLKKLNCKNLVLPFYGKSNLTKKNINFMHGHLKKILHVLKKKKINLLIETNLAPIDYLKLKNHFRSKNFKLVFDTGNRVLESTNLEKDIILLKNEIGHIHIKDKNSLKKNVKL